jgi:peptide-methionine (S)-S-oxide reductase
LFNVFTWIKTTAKGRNFMLKLLAAIYLAITLQTQVAFAKTETIIVAGGCFWCVESDFDKVAGVISTTSGYAGGTIKNPNYKNHEGYQEAVKIEYDSDVIPFEKLINKFLRTIDVTDSGGQFCDRGEAYESAIFVNSEAQINLTKKIIAAAAKSLSKTILTPVRLKTTFTNAEDYHQNYHLGKNRVLTRFGWIKQSDAYERYREGCGRDAQVKKTWGAQAYTDGN